MSDNNFYRAFEDKYRGSRELIKSRLEVYLPFIKKIKEIEPEPKVIDLGCGRGEWLELTREYGFQSHGIDMDAGMLENVKSLGLSAELGDAVEYLKTLPDESISIVSGFHIVEHLPFDVLQFLIQEALRVLKPGGLIILETPNPENIKVATADFYLDPTHIRPIPPQLLTFLTEYYGFKRTNILRLQESNNTESITLSQVIRGVSPDYSVVAQKQIFDEVMSNFDELFAKEYGLSLEILEERFENRLLKIETQINEVNVFIQQMQASVQQMQASVEQMQASVEQIQASIFWKLLKIIKSIMLRRK